MEEINGVTFRDYACANANIVSGMPLEDVCKVLGIEVPVWEETVNKWNNKMSELSMDDMNFYGQVFTNPKQGKFENVEFTGGIDDVLAKYPEWSDSIKMTQYSAAASSVGIDIDMEKEFGITLTEFSQLAMHWSGYFKEKVMDVQNQTSQEMLNNVELTEDQKEASRLFALHGELTNKWEAYYKEKYQDKNANLSEDIDF